MIQVEKVILDYLRAHEMETVECSKGFLQYADNHIMVFKPDGQYSHEVYAWSDKKAIAEIEKII